MANPPYRVEYITHHESIWICSEWKGTEYTGLPLDTALEAKRRLMRENPYNTYRIVKDD